jgi:serine/threonine-protein kinase
MDKPTVVPESKIVERLRTRAQRHSLPADLAQDAARRLAVVALFGALIATVFFVSYNVFLHLLDFEASDWAGYVLLVLLSAAIVVLYRWKIVPPPALLDLGLVYEALVALIIGLLVYRVPWPDAMLPGYSPVAVWVLFFAIFVPNTYWKTVIGAALAACMDPLALWIWIAKGLPVPAGELLFMRFFPNLIVVVTVAAYTLVYHRLGAIVSEARRLGRYQLEELLGQGGMGEVWRASHRLLVRQAAIKLITPRSLGAVDRQAADTAAQRFEREAQATAALRSPHTIDVYDFGRTRDGTFYYVMELLDGLDLETLVERFGPQPAARVIPLLRQACHSLSEAHAAGLVHRDVKPANLFVCRYGEDLDFVKVLDFGLVKSQRFDGAGDGSLTLEGITAGTPAYLAPEQAVGRREIDGRADLYALGCVGYWLLTGELVFDAASPMRVIVDHARREPEPPSTRCELDIPPELDRVILACLQKRPADRPQTAGELAAMLAEVPIARPWTPEQAAHWWSVHVPEV